ncbi:MAG TPA: hypothetical protein VGQ06_05435 [Gemmatimonadales bacterium]|jgi:hypothetical protein|nr:hypothetical protein [Gemmatimonadales bacterium]
MRFAAVLALTFATQAQAQEPRLERLDSAARAPVAAVLDSARAAGLPVEPLLQRALEGTIKHAAPDRVVAAVRRLAGDLGRAREALGVSAAPAELEAGAAALRAGASPAVLAQLRRARRQPLTVPLAVLADLVASGVPVDSAASAVLMLAGSVRDADLIEFRRAVERDIALGASPATAATADAPTSLNATARPRSAAQPRRP